jgi:hypothetical protein
MANTPGATPLTRYGRRISATTTPAVNPSPAASPTAVVAPAPTIRTMIVCVPDELPREALTARHLDRHFGVGGTLSPRFWATPALYPWQRGHLFDLRKGRPAYCAGGPLRLLDPTGMRHAAGMGAGIRHQTWARVVHGTKAATPWHIFETRHLADPTKYPLDAATAAFHNQPRVNAMRMHNAVTYANTTLDVDELEMFQAGLVAYQHYCAATAVCGDALLTAEGAKLAPESDAFAHRVTYLEQATRYLDTLAATQRLLAVAL